MNICCQTIFISQKYNKFGRSFLWQHMFTNIIESPSIKDGHRPFKKIDLTTDSGSWLYAL